MPPETKLGGFLQVPRNGLTLDLVNCTHKKVYENKPAKFGNLVSSEETFDEDCFDYVRILKDRHLYRCYIICFHYS